jgi:hypothetical protein
MATGLMAITAMATGLMVMGMAGPTRTTQNLRAADRSRRALLVRVGFGLAPPFMQ